MTHLFMQKDKRWTFIWLATMVAVGIWDILFLNGPALSRVVQGFFNTFAIAILVLIFTLFLGWLVTASLHWLQSRSRTGYLALVFVINLIRSIPQVVGILLGYVAVGYLIETGTLHADFSSFPLLAFCMSLFISPEMVDLMRERIEHFLKLDFYSAMRLCGIRESRIIHFDILWKNSRSHILNKLISVLGSAVFLMCSVDFIVSVGLSTDVNQVILPTTLGGLLAKIDSKQDILAVGYTLTHPAYIGQIFTQHLQGVTVAFLLVFSLLSLYHISNGFAERHRL